MFTYDKGNTNQSPRILFTSKYNDVKLIYSFIHAKWIFVIYTESSKEDGVYTKVGRLCVNEDTLFSYTETAINCQSKQGSLYNDSSIAYCTKNYDSRADTQVFYVGFRETSGSTSSPIESILCKFTFGEIHKSLDYSRCSSLDRVKKQSCTSGKPNALTGKLVAAFSEVGTALAVTTQNNHDIAIVGTSRGNVLKIILHENRESSICQTCNVSVRSFIKKVGTDPVNLRILPSVAFDKKEEYLFILQGRTVIKFPVVSCYLFDHAEKCRNSSDQCVWCENKCTARHQCREGELIGKPVIDLDCPMNGSLGGARLKLKGRFGDISVTNYEKQVSFTVGNEACKLENFHYHPQSSNFSWSAECTTGDRKTEVNESVVVKIRDLHNDKIIDQAVSERSFFFLKPVIIDMSPKYGPKAGGTNITISGVNLNIGANQSVSIIGLPCKISRNNGTNIMCTTSPSEDALNGSLTLSIDGKSIKAKDENAQPKFAYKINPEIEIDGEGSTITIDREYTHITVIGHHLDSVANPKIRLTYNVLNQQMTSNGICSSNIYGKQLNCTSHHLKKMSNMLSGAAQVKVTVKLIMDGVNTRDFNVAILKDVAKKQDGNKALAQKEEDRLFEHVLTDNSISEKGEDSDDASMNPGYVACIIAAVLVFLGIIALLTKKKLSNCKRTPYDQIENAWQVTYTKENKGRSGATFKLYTSFPELYEDILENVELGNFLVPRDCLHLGNTISSGTFGCVYKGSLVVSDKPPLQVIVKTIRPDITVAPNDARRLLQETLVLKDFDHPNVLQNLGICLDTRRLPMVILPFMQHGYLHSFLQKESNEINMDMLLSFGIQIAEGMNYLSSHSFVHRDLATRNCLLDASMVVKISDLELSHDVHRIDYYRDGGLETEEVIRWKAPETISTGFFTEQSNVWSFGVVLWELATRGKLPYAELNSSEIFSHIQEGNRLPKPAFCPEILYKLMLECWSENRHLFRDLIKQLHEARDSVPNRALERMIPVNDNGLANYGSESLADLNFTYTSQNTNT